MRIALCAPFMEADLLEQKIREAVPEEKIEIDEYRRIDALLALPGLFMYDAVWVAFPGAAGMEAVFAVREQNPDAPIVWVINDPGFIQGGTGRRLSMFLMPDSPLEEFRTAVDNSRRTQGRRNCQ